MKWLGSGVVVLVALLLACVLWYRWDSSSNRGYTFGYYGQFNRVRGAAAGIPGVTIVSAAFNPDISLEEFGFDVRMDDGRALSIWFTETDPIRRMRGKELEDALRVRLAAASSATSGETTK